MRGLQAQRFVGWGRAGEAGGTSAAGGHGAAAHSGQAVRRAGRQEPAQHRTATARRHTAQAERPIRGRPGCAVQEWHQDRREAACSPGWALSLQWDAEE